MTDEMTDVRVLPDAAPGTVAGSLPPPEPVADALRMIDGGEVPSSMIDWLSDAYPVDALRAAQLWWVRRMPKARWDDHRASTVLRVLEEAVKAVDPKLARKAAS